MMFTVLEAQLLVILLVTQVVQLIAELQLSS